MAKTEEHLRWLKAISKETSEYVASRVGPLPSLGALTGTDTMVLAAIERCCWQVYAYTNGKGVLRAIAELAAEMQPSTRCFARALIAHAMDWGDIERLWPEVEELMQPMLEQRSAAKSITVQALEAAARASASGGALLALVSVLMLAACNGVPPPNIEGAPCTATTATYKEIACGLRLDTSLHTRCVMECKRDLGRWVVQTCLPECGTGGFYVGEPGETGECYLPTVPCAVDGGAR